MTKKSYTTPSTVDNRARTHLQTYIPLPAGGAFLYDQSYS